MGLWLVGNKAQVHVQVIVDLQGSHIQVGGGYQTERGVQKKQSFKPEVNSRHNGNHLGEHSHALSRVLRGPGT